VLPIYDEIFQQNDIRHILVRHEQGAVHAAEGYARATGKPGVVLVTSGPGATNAVTGLTDALMDSIPIVVLTGQVPTFMIGSDAFQEADTVGITRPCTKHELAGEGHRQLSDTIHEAFHVATSGPPRPGAGRHPQGRAVRHRHLHAAAKAKPPRHYQPQVKGDMERDHRAGRGDGDRRAPGLLHRRRRDQLRPAPASCCANWSRPPGFPITSTLMGLGAYPGLGQELARHAGDARALRGQPGDA
jgi:acetolactate synthase-1/2/3 large subunit